MAETVKNEHEECAIHPDEDLYEINVDGIKSLEDVKQLFKLMNLILDKRFVSDFEEVKHLFKKKTD